MNLSSESNTLRYRCSSLDFPAASRSSFIKITHRRRSRRTYTAFHHGAGRSRGVVQQPSEEIQVHTILLPCHVVWRTLTSHTGWCSSASRAVCDLPCFHNWVLRRKRKNEFANDDMRWQSGKRHSSHASCTTHSITCTKPPLASTSSQRQGADDAGSPKIGKTQLTECLDDVSRGQDGAVTALGYRRPGKIPKFDPILHPRLECCRGGLRCIK